MPTIVKNILNSAGTHRTPPRATLLRLTGVWAIATFFALSDTARDLAAASPLAAGTAFAVLFGTVLVSAFGVVAQADRLAAALGDPYGTLVLTLSVVAIEVALISAVMLGPGDAEGIGRDSIFSLLMIALNLVMGICLVAGGIRNGEQDYNVQGAISYLSLVTVLTIVALVLPVVSPGPDGSFAANHAVAVAAAVFLLYAGFIALQLKGYSHFFTQPEAGPARAKGREVIAAGDPSLSPRGVLARAALLLAFVLPIVLLSGDLALLSEVGIERTGAPGMLGGVLIATIVFTPESISSVRAALANRFQRALNIGLGACLSTLGVTVPAILVIGHITGQVVVLGLAPTEVVLLLTTLALTTLTFLGHRTSPVQGLAHLTVFAVFAIMLFG